MKNIKQKAFTLVELLVVITILSILSVVAYQSFGWATDKAQNVTKKSNIATLWSTLENFYISKNYYPMPQIRSATNMWWYNSSVDANKSNTIEVQYNDQEIKNIVSANWWWKIMNLATPTLQIWAKWVIWRSWSFNKKYLKKDIYDTQLWDIKLIDSGDKMINYWIGKYTYAIYARAKAVWAWNIWAQTAWKYYELATTLKNTDWEWYITYLEWNYSRDNFNTPADYPETLIWIENWSLDDSTKITTNPEQWIPYPIDWFVWNQAP